MRTVFMFSGQGSQYYQMGSKLFATDTTFRKHLYELDEVVRSVQGISVIDELYAPQNRLFDPFLPLKLTHPAIFMTEYALAKVLEEQGIFPDYLLGCSLGEFAAATISGIISEVDAIRLILKQAEIIENTCPEGRLIAVLQDMDIYHRSVVMKHNSAIASINSPSQFVIAGAVEPLDLVKRFMKENDVLHQELMVNYGFHSPAVDPAQEAYVAYLKGQVFRPPAIPVISGVTGTTLNKVTENYCWEVVRKPTDYVSAIATLERVAGTEDELMYVDLGPSGSLANLIKYNVKGDSRSKGFQIMSPFQQELKKLEEVKQYYQEHKRKTITRDSSKNERLLACVFPGQGSQKRGMGEDLFGLFPRLTDQASELLGYSIKELCIQDPNRHLNLTQYTQPALYVVNVLSYLKLKEEEGIVPDFVAGHSLGEYNALFAAGAMDFETGLRLVQKRGEVMATMKEGGMAAVKGLSEEDIRYIIGRHGLEGVDIANYNSPNQIVLSGPKAVIDRSGHHFEAAGATLYFPLNVSGAFHSRFMLPAKKEFEQFLQPFDFLPLKIPVISNVGASLYPADGIKTLLSDQLIRPVRWTESISFLLKEGVVVFKETGPGDVLTKLIWSIQKDSKAVEYL